jgi:TAT-translocated FGD2 family F420-dependent dehydrogenase
MEQATVSRRSLPGGGAALAAYAGLSGTAEAASTTKAVKKAPVGFVLSHEQFPGPKLVHWAPQVEQYGFSYAWTSDHLQPWQDNEGHSTHPWLTQALIGQSTSKLTFGTGVTCPTYRHHPSEVAQAFASLGVFNPGRVFLGVGIGEALNEQAGTGQFAPYTERAARLVEAVHLIRKLWTGEHVTFNGTYYKTVDLKIWDLPQHRVPIMMAASGPKSAYNAGRWGDGWICSAKDLAKAELREAFARGAADAGKDPDKMPKYVEQFVVVNSKWADYTANLWRFTVNPWEKLVYDPVPSSIRQRAYAMFSRSQVLKGLPIGKDADKHIAALQASLDLGGTPFVHSAEPDQTYVMEWYAAHVLPHVHR